MAATFTQLHPQVAQSILDTFDEHGGVSPQLYRIVYIARIHPNESDLSEVALVQVILHDFASDAESFRQRFMDNVPELYPVLFVISIAPMSPDIPADGMLQVKTGPRAVEN